MAKKIKPEYPYHLKVELKSTTKEMVIKELKQILKCAQDDITHYGYGDDGEGFQSAVDFVEWK